MRKPIYETDGLRVTPETYTVLEGGMPRDGLRVEVMVVGGDWLLSEPDAARLYTALGEWLVEPGTVAARGIVATADVDDEKKRASLGEIGDVIADRVVERVVAATMPPSETAIRIRNLEASVVELASFVTTAASVNRQLVTERDALLAEVERLRGRP